MTKRSQNSYNYTGTDHTEPVDLSGSFEYAIRNMGNFTVYYGWDKSSKPDIPLDPGSIHSYTCAPGDEWSHILYIMFGANASTVTVIKSCTNIFLN